MGSLFAGPGDRDNGPIPMTNFDVIDLDHTVWLTHCRLHRLPICVLNSSTCVANEFFSSETKYMNCKSASKVLEKKSRFSCQDT